MSGPIDRFLEELGSDANPESLVELRSHLEESTEALTELGLERSEAERAAIGLLGENDLVHQAVKKPVKIWSFLFGGDKKIRIRVGVVTTFIYIYGHIMTASGLGDGVMHPFSFGLSALVWAWIVWQSTRSSKVGPLAICLSVLVGVLTAVSVGSILISYVPVESGLLAWRWDLGAKHTEFLAYQDKIWNSAVGRVYSRMDPGILSYEAAKPDIWATTGGLGIWGTFKLSMVLLGRSAIFWLGLPLAGGIFGFLYRLVSRGGIRLERGLREE